MIKHFSSFLTLLLLGLALQVTIEVHAAHFALVDKASALAGAHNLSVHVKRALTAPTIGEDIVDELIHGLRPFIKGRFFDTAPVEIYNSLIAANPTYSGYSDFGNLQNQLLGHIKALYVKKIRLLLQRSDANIGEAIHYSVLLNGINTIFYLGGITCPEGQEAWDVIEESERFNRDWENAAEANLHDNEGFNLEDTPENRESYRRLFLEHWENMRCEPGYAQFLRNNIHFPTDPHVKIVKKRMARSRFELGKLQYSMAKHLQTACSKNVLAELKAILPAQEIPLAFPALPLLQEPSTSEEAENLALSIPNLNGNWTFAQARKYFEASITDEALPLEDRASATLFFAKLNNPDVALPNPDPLIAQYQVNKAGQWLTFLRIVCNYQLR